MTYPRDLVGYGPTPPDPNWPDGARIAVNIVLNYEEGGERSVLHGDPESETFLSEIIGARAFPRRHMSMESLYEYGSRAGVWRILRLVRDRGLPLTVFAVAMAAERHPEVIRAAMADGHEIASHGLRWIDHDGMPEAEERAQMDAALAIFERLGAPIHGWYTGRTSENTRRLVAERGFLYDADDYSDDLPFWNDLGQLVVPYTLDVNDMRFATAQGFNTADHFFTYARDAFDALYAEGGRMMSVGLHCRLIGRPGRILGLARLLDHIAGHEGVWVATRADIARHWRATHPA